ncbi:transcriptional regulator [Streptomyces sp. NPDC055134]
MTATAAARAEGRTTAPAGVSPMLRRLAEERATGALLRDRGTLYLADGQVVHAESPATPGIDVLLTTGGALHPDGWWEAVDAAGTQQRVGRYLVESGRLTDGALELCHLGALYDAAFFALAPSGAPARFRYGAAHWFGTVHPVSVASVETETLRRRELLHGIRPDAATDTVPLERDGGGHSPAVPPRQRAVLALVDGARTAADISHVLGRPAFHTLVDLRRLAAAGLVRAAAPRPLPPAPAVPAWAGAASADADVALLRRLRDALEAL